MRNTVPLVCMEYTVPSSPVQVGCTLSKGIGLISVVSFQVGEAVRTTGSRQADSESLVALSS